MTSQSIPKNSKASGETLIIEDFDIIENIAFIKEVINPYLKDLFRDLSLRCTNS